MSRKDDFACFICDYWWVFLILLMLLLGAALTKNLWGPAVFPVTPTPVPTATLSPATPQPTPGTGDVQITLSWSGINDLDLHVIDPSGEEIFFDYRTSQSNGLLDIDSNAGCDHNITDQPIENIYWPFGEAPKGEYKIYVVYFEQCNTQTSTSFTIRVLVDGLVKEFTGQVDSQNDRKLIYEFSR